MAARPEVRRLFTNPIINLVASQKKSWPKNKEMNYNFGLQIKPCKGFREFTGRTLLGSTWPLSSIQSSKRRIISTNWRWSLRPTSIWTYRKNADFRMTSLMSCDTRLPRVNSRVLSIWNTSFITRYSQIKRKKTGLRMIGNSAGHYTWSHIEAHWWPFRDIINFLKKYTIY